MVFCKIILTLKLSKLLHNLDLLKIKDFLNRYKFILAFKANLKRVIKALVLSWQLLINLNRFSLF